MPGAGCGLRDSGAAHLAFGFRIATRQALGGGESVMPVKVMNPTDKYVGSARVSEWVASWETRKERRSPWGV